MHDLHADADDDDAGTTARTRQNVRVRRYTTTAAGQARSCDPLCDRAVCAHTRE